MSENTNLIGNAIRRIRKEKAMTQDELAKKSGIAAPTIRKYESGRLNPKARTIKKIADALSVPVSSIAPPEYFGFDATKIIEAVTNAAQKILPDITVDPETFSIALKKYEESIPEELKDADMEEIELVANFRSLNLLGRAEATKRVEELTQIPKYTTPEKAESEPLRLEDSGLMAAHNDNNDPDQMEKMKRDLDMLGKLQ